MTLKRVHAAELVVVAIKHSQGQLFRKQNITGRSVMVHCQNQRAATTNLAQVVRNSKHLVQMDFCLTHQLQY